MVYWRKKAPGFGDKEGADSLTTLLKMGRIVTGKWGGEKIRFLNEM